MSSMGVIYNSADSANSSCSSSSSSHNDEEQQQLVLLQRALQDNDSNIIAAAAKNNVSVISQALPAYDPSRLKKHGKNGQPPPVAVAKRNARERNRVKQVNNGFATLRQHIPAHVAQGYGDRGKKLSKVETLRMAVEYIRGLQRLLAEADGCTATDLAARLRQHDSPLMVPSPTGSVYSNGTNNGSTELLGLDEQQQLADVQLMDEDEELENDEPKQQHERRAKRSRAHSRVSDKRCRRREDDYRYKQACFGDEENIEPLMNRSRQQQQHHHHNNNSSSHNHNHNGFSQSILLNSDSDSQVLAASVKREVQLQLDADEDESQRSSEAGLVLATSSSAYTGEIFIENPETGRLVPLKIEEHEAAQLVYVSAGPATTTAYYKAELPDSAAELSWWEQECIVQQIQQPSTPSQRALAHV